MPTRVFGKSLELYAGSEINKTRLIFELEQLGYVRSQQLTKSGQFTVSANQIVFFPHRNQAKYTGTELTKIAVLFSGMRISSVFSLESKKRFYPIG